MEDCLFCKIVAGEIPAEIVHVTERTVAFRDINAQAPTHVLVVPRDHYANAAELAAGDPAGLRRAGDHGRGRRHRRGARRLPPGLQHRRGRRADRLPHPPAPARRAPDDLAARMSRDLARALAAVAAAVLVVLPLAGLRPARTTTAASGVARPLLEPAGPAGGAGPAARRDQAGQAAPAARGRAADDAHDADDVHAVGADRRRHRRLPLLPARPAAWTRTSG